MSRKLDAAIAGKLGWDVTHIHGFFSEERYYIHHGEKDEGSLPGYSQNGAAMLELDQAMRERKFMLKIERVLEPSMYPFYVATYISGDNEFYADADTMPEAVALASYRALTGKKWEEESD